MTQKVARFLKSAIETGEEVDVDATSDCLRTSMRVRVQVDITKPLRCSITVSLEESNEEITVLL
ncbi:hypothetical protein PanWU01x14_209810 [Parasponia andersonii]|uniref:Uncharacterized protein n=1 Tax=Parasponia andersonii TaxID=3476 RepID=A0A2P5BUB7_PARAD|nr:hypothetical protein PanWU01x14_209810 [Parasponia andersonii]